MQIPLTDVKGKLKDLKNVPPKVGTEWRVNFFPLDKPARRPQIGARWSPPMGGDFHALDKSGVLIFGDDKARAPQLSAAKAPEAPAAPAPAKKDEKVMPAAPKKAEAEPAQPGQPNQRTRAAAARLNVFKPDNQ